MLRRLFPVLVALPLAAGSFGCAQETTGDDFSTNADFEADELRVGESCAPSRAVGVVSKKRKAFLDTIAYAEGTRNAGGADGYNVLYSFKLVSDCTSHPNKNICAGNYCSTAAGRYQFLTRTWRGLGLPTFKPENQERGAMKLLTARGITLPESRTMTATEFKTAMDKASYEWASLPPGRYGQPQRSLSSLRTVYCNAAGGC